MRRLTAVLAAAVLATGGCAGTGGNGRQNDVVPGTSGDPGRIGPGTGGPDTGGPVELRVLADESLSQAFGVVEQHFEEQHPNVEVVVAYAPGVDLARRIAGGEPGDVFATDDLSAMRTVTDAGAPAREAAEFGGGRLTVTVLRQAADPALAASLVDFLREGDGQRILIDSGLLRP